MTPFFASLLSLLGTRKGQELGSKFHFPLSSGQQQPIQEHSVHAEVSWEAGPL